ncbi:hypothetical protein [Aquimarina aquimarini]|nr:hypothetical protein [Aquimarina aquimarini]
MKISNYSLIIILAFFANFCLKAQTSIKDDVSNLKKGIYKNFDEFKYNNPSIKLDYEILVQTIKYGGINDRKIITYYRLDVTKDKQNQLVLFIGFGT